MKPVFCSGTALFGRSKGFAGRTGEYIGLSLFFCAVLVVVLLSPSVGLAAPIDLAWAAKFAPPAALPPLTAAEKPIYALGRLVFFEPRLSNHGGLSCATCHNPALAWGNGLARAVGDDGQPMPLRSPTILNVDQIDTFGWDGKFPSLESVTFAAIGGRKNMNLSPQDALARLGRIAAYRDGFAAAFPGRGLTRATVEQAVALFERRVRSGIAPFDRYAAGDEGAISLSAARGFALFSGRAHCAECHSGWAFTDGSFHDIGTALGMDIGRGRLFPTSIKLRYAFKTPTLRDVARRAPYMHDGSLPDLDAVIALYDKGGIARPSRAEFITPLQLSAVEKTDLRAFLLTLTQAPYEVALPVLPR